MARSQVKIECTKAYILIQYIDANDFYNYAVTLDLKFAKKWCEDSSNYFDRRQYEEVNIYKDLCE